MLCCVYTVINKLGLAEPEARPTPAQTVRCLSNFFFFFSNFIVMNWTVYSSGDPQTPVSLGCCHCCTHCWCWPSLPGLCCCCDSVVAELCCCGCEAGGRGWPRPSHHLVCGRRRERHRQLHWYTPRARRGYTFPVSHWSESACCSPLIGQILSVGLSLGLCCPLGPVSTLCWSPVSLQRRTQTKGASD